MRDELANRDKFLRAKLKERDKTFINEKLKRDKELLKILEVREKEIEKNMLQKVDAFRYLYKEHQKEIKATIHKRNEDMEASLNSREKLWIDSLDICNSNMIKMYNAQGEFEGELNSIGGRKNELIRNNARMVEWMTNQLLGDKIAIKPQASISDFTPSQAGYQYDLVNLKPSKSQKKNK